MDGSPTLAMADIQTAPNARFAVALPANADHYFLIKFEGKLSVTKVSTPAPIATACLADGFLYALSNGNPSKIEKLEVETGKVRETFPLQGGAPAPSLPVLPAHLPPFFTPDPTIIAP